MMHGVPNIYVPSISHYTSNGGRMSLPVESSALIYSHFQYVSGIPAPEGTNGVTITRLNLLDVLIGRLNQINDSSLSSQNGEEALRFADLDLDELIDTYRTRLEETLSANAAMPYNPFADPQTGGLFSLLI